MRFSAYMNVVVCDGYIQVCSADWDKTSSQDNVKQTHCAQQKRQICRFDQGYVMFVCSSVSRISQKLINRF